MSSRSRTQALAPRDAFLPQHKAQCHLSKSVLARPADISNHHLRVTLPLNDEVPSLGQEFRDVKLKVSGRTFVLSCLVVEQIRRAGTDEVDLILSACPEQETDSQLWEVIYLLRVRQPQATGPEYDERTLPKIPARGLYTEEARQERLAFAHAQTGADLSEVAHTRLDPQRLVSNIEAFIGSVEIPVGLAGPLLIKGVHAGGLYYAPMATSEGALVASATRGATALSRSGGVTARVLGQRMMRVPLFGFENMNSAMFFAEWVKDRFHDLSAEVRKYSNYAQLVEIQAQVMGRNVHVHFIYETGDAAGQNMTTTCTWQACQWILGQIKRFKGLRLDNFLIEANLSNDKKVTYQTYLKGRGVRVLAEAVLTDEVCRKVLKVTAAQLVKAYQNFVAGSLAAGMVGLNINVANVIASMFTALGQDIACVHESSLAHLHMELTQEGDAYCTMTLPSLVIGTVGGGTNLPQQKECLSLIDCAGPGRAGKLGEVIAAYCLALDISTLSAIAADQFARAHEKLGRNRPVHYLKLGDLDRDFFNRIFSGNAVGSVVQDVKPLAVQSKGSSIITELTSHKINKLVGHFPYTLSMFDGSTVKVMTKVKPLDDEVIIMLSSMAAMCDPRLSQCFLQHRAELGFKGTDVRELAVMSQTDPRFTRNAPKVYGVLAQHDREAFVIVEELLENMVHMDSADDTSEWGREHLEAAIKGIAEVHSIWYGREEELIAQPWLVDHPTSAGMSDKHRLWELMAAHLQEEFPEAFGEEDMVMFRTLVQGIDQWWGELEAMPRTLIHNDFNPRNIAFRNTPEGLRLCAYDWELATLHVPQHDLAELLMFTLQGDFTVADVAHYVELHRTELERHTGQAIDRVQWERGYRLAVQDLVVSRIPLYAMAHTFRQYKFMDRVFQTCRELVLTKALWAHPDHLSS